MWSLFKKRDPLPPSPIFLTNTLTGDRAAFVPQKPGVVTLYTCGPTVYDRAHIGNMRAFVFADVLARTLAEAGNHVRRVINITDVGHLVGDAEQGVDKFTVAAEREKQSPEKIASRYTQLFIEDIKSLNIDPKSILFPRATEYIQEQIAMIKVLEAKGHTYRTADGLYFDTASYPDYGKLGGVPEEIIKHGTADTLVDRVSLSGHGRIKENTEKRNPADFALWRSAKLLDLQKWPSPWGPGNPGWHIECSAMIKALLGETIDIHTGGMDHIAIHHNNEIAQSEATHGRPLARYWLHNAFLTIAGDKISKSLKNDIYVTDIVERGFHPLALRYFFLQAHYRTPLSFSWEALAASQEALMRLWKLCDEIRLDAKNTPVASTASSKIVTILREDLSTPQALAYLWEYLKDDALTAKEVWGVVVAADPILGLMLTNPPVRTRPYTVAELPEDIQTLVLARETARKAKNYHEADRVRIHLEERGYRVDDSPSGPLLTPLSR
ncbi:MAG TPA: cysteine--tRNA ligase [Candidatus Paceibacterota bacterium]|nr:cysteine--tRNA ligase [Candidatus Paceibacterota bacterium]